MNTKNISFKRILKVKNGKEAIKYTIYIYVYIMRIIKNSK